MLLSLELPARYTQRNSLKRDEDNGQHNGRPVGAAQGPKVRLGSHGYRLPAARPADQGVGGGGGVDGVEEDDCDERGCEAEQGRDEHHWRVKGGVLADLWRVRRLVSSFYRRQWKHHFIFMTT